MIIACWRKFLLLHDAVYNVSMMHCKSECDPEVRGHRPAFEKIDFTDFLVFLIKRRGMGRLSLNYTMPPTECNRAGRQLVAGGFHRLPIRKNHSCFFCTFLL